MGLARCTHVTSDRHRPHRLLTFLADWKRELKEGNGGFKLDGEKRDRNRGAVSAGGNEILSPPFFAYTRELAPSLWSQQLVWVLITFSSRGPVTRMALEKHPI
jgi:hypothetical protein